MLSVVKASWLKEFFNVDLMVFNDAAPGFTLAGGTATLNLPASGLTLADTGARQSLTVSMPNIQAGQEGHASWIVRGDTAGSYPISATYSASLKPTDLPVRLTAAPAEPIRVWGLEAIEFIIEHDAELNSLDPYHVRVGMRNVSDVPVYNAEMSFAAADGRYWYQPGQRRAFDAAVIPAGSTFWTDELIVIDGGSVYTPTNYVTAKVSGLTASPRGWSRSNRRSHRCSTGREREQRDPRVGTDCRRHVLQDLRGHARRDRLRRRRPDSGRGQ